MAQVTIQDVESVINGGIFNPIDINSSSLNQTSAKEPVDVEYLNSISGDFLNKYGTVELVGNLSVREGASLLFPDGLQVSSFNEGHKDALNLHKTKLAKVLTDLDNNFQIDDSVRLVVNKLTIKSADVDDALNIPNESISKNKIVGLVNKLGLIDTHFSNLDTNVSNLSTDLTTISGNLATQTTKLTNLKNNTESSIDTINTHLVTLDASIGTNGTSLTSLNTTVAGHTTTLSTHTSQISTANSNISTLQVAGTTLTNKVTNLETFQTSANSTLNTHGTHLTNIDTSITNLNTSVSSLQTSNTTNTNNITTLLSNSASNTLDIASLNTQVDEHQTALELHETQLTEVATEMATHQTSIDTLTTTSASHSSQISALQNADIVLQTNINGKQNAINTLNRLNANLIGDGYVNNIQFSTLSGISTEGTIQWQLDNITSQLSSLNTLENLDIAQLQTISSNITQLQSYINSLQTQDATQATFNSNTTSSINSINGEITTINSSLFSHANTLSIIESSLNDAQTLITGIQSELSLKSATLLSHQTAIDELVTIVTTLQTSLGETNANVVSLQTGLETVNNSVTNLQTTSLSQTNSINSLNSSVTSQENNIQLLITDVGGLQTSVTSQGQSIQGLLADVSTVENSIVSLSNSVSSSLDEKQNTITVANKIPYNLIDISGSAVRFYDYENPLSLKFQEIDASINGINTNVSNLNTGIGSLQSHDLIHDGKIEVLEGNVTTLQTQSSQLQSDILARQLTINSTNKLSSDLIDVSSVSLTDVLGQKQSVIDVEHKLPISYVDLSGNALRFVDINSSLQTQLTNITGAVATLQGLQNNDITTFQAIQDNFTTIDGLLAGKQDAITNLNKLDSSLIGTGEVNNIKFNYLKNLTGDIQNQLDQLTLGGNNALPSLSYDSNNLITSVDGSLKLTNNNIIFSDNSVQSIAFSSSKNSQLNQATSDITEVIDQVTIHETSITNLTTAVGSATTSLSGKQDAISALNKLPISYVDLSGNSLNYVDINSSLSGQLSAINSSLSSLQAEDVSQTALNNQFTSDISTLYSSKNAVIDTANKLSSLFVSYSTGTVSSFLDGLSTTYQTIISSTNKLASNLVQYTDNSLNTQTVQAYLRTQDTLNANAITSDGQNVKLTGIQTIGGDKTFTGTISGITKTMVGLGNVDNTTDTDKPVSTAQQTALDLKANLASPTFTGTLATPAVKITTGATNGYFLKSDALGNASWASPSVSLTNQSVAFSGVVYPSGANGSGTWKTLGSITVTAGTYLIYFFVDYILNTSSNTVTGYSRTLCTNTGDINGSYITNSSGGSMHAGVALAVNDIYGMAPSMCIVSPSVTTTYYCVAMMTYTGTGGFNHRSGSSMLSVKIA